MICQIMFLLWKKGKAPLMSTNPPVMYTKKYTVSRFSLHDKMLLYILEVKAYKFRNYRCLDLIWFDRTWDRTKLLLITFSLSEILRNFCFKSFAKFLIQSKEYRFMLNLSSHSQFQAFTESHRNTWNMKKLLK